jgi:hypothetical protein
VPATAFRFSSANSRFSRSTTALACATSSGVDSNTRSRFERRERMRGGAAASGSSLALAWVPPRNCT